MKNVLLLMKILNNYLISFQPSKKKTKINLNRKSKNKKKQKNKRLSLSYLQKRKTLDHIKTN